MADSTVGALTAASALTGTELFYGVQSANDVKITASQIATFAGGGTGTGDVTGPAVAVADHVATYDGITGKLIKDGGQTITSIIASSISGSGNVVGPGGAVSDHIAVFDGVTGRLIKDGGQSLSSLSLTSSQISDFSEATDDRVASLLVAGSNVTLTYNDPANTLTIASTGGGGGGMAIGGTITGATLGSVLFAGPSGVLAQNNANFGWDDTHHALLIEGQNAVFRVPNASGDNWFEGGAGNFALTGFSNFGTGPSALQYVTTGNNNVAFGPRALQDLDNGTGNFAVGTGALQSNINGSNNTAIGINALRFLNSGSAGSGNNVALGLQAGFNNTGEASVFIGTQAGLSIGAAASDTFIGRQSGSSLTTGIKNNIIGANAFDNATSGSNNTMLGHQVGHNLSDGNYNTLLGLWQGPSASMSRVIGIADGTITNLNLDFNFTKQQVWSFNYDQYWGTPVGLHVYNMQDPGASPTNYERAILDWNVTANVFRVGTQKGGTGTIRLTAIDGFAKAGAPAAGDLPSGTFAVIKDTSAGKPWLTYNDGGTIKQTEIGAAGGGGGMAIGGAVSGGTSGSILYVDSSTNLAQQNANLFFDDPNNALKIGAGHTYNIDTFRALYQVPNASGDNWFEGDAGNTSVTGHNNFGTGSGCLFAVTSGSGNTGVGAFAITGLTTGSDNFAFGTRAMSSLVSGSSNVAVGPFAMQSGQVQGSCVAIGNTAMQAIGNIAGGGSSGDVYNVAIGQNAFQTMTKGGGNIAIGGLTAQNMSDCDGGSNTIVGFQAAQTATGTNLLNTLVGAFAAKNASHVNGCTVLGYWPGPSANISNCIVFANGDFTGNAYMDYNYTTAGYWTANGNFKLASGFGFGAISKAGAPAAGDLPSGTFAVIDDTSGGATWLVFNKAGTIRKVQLT